MGKDLPRPRKHVETKARGAEARPLLTSNNSLRVALSRKNSALGIRRKICNLGESAYEPRASRVTYQRTISAERTVKCATTRLHPAVSSPLSTTAFLRRIYGSLRLPCAAAVGRARRLMSYRVHRGQVTFPSVLPRYRYAHVPPPCAPSLPRTLSLQQSHVTTRARRYTIRPCVVYLRNRSRMHTAACYAAAATPCVGARGIRKAGARGRS